MILKKAPPAVLKDVLNALSDLAAKRVIKKIAATRDPLLNPIIEKINALAAGSHTPAQDECQISTQELLERLEKSVEMISSLAALDFKNALQLLGDKRTSYGFTASLNALAQDLKLCLLSKQELEEKNTLLNAIVENIPISVFLKDANDNFKFTLWNKQAEISFELPRAQVLGKTAYDLWPKEQADRYVAADKKVARENVIIEDPEDSRPSKTRGTVYFHTKKLPLPLPGSPEVQYVLGLAEEIAGNGERSQRG